MALAPTDNRFGFSGSQRIEEQERPAEEIAIHPIAARVHERLVKDHQPSVLARMRREELE